MRIIATTLAAAVLVGAAITGTAFAHHGWDAYDAAKQQKVTGTVAELKWEQPHAVLWITVNGTRQEVWLSPLQRMIDRGLNKDMLTVGKSVTVEVQPHAKNANEWKALAITVDGKDVNLMR
jgi:methylmalonyl-CoA mutase cobalamin-binding subunit